MQEYWSGLPFPSPGDLPDPGMEPSSPASLQADPSTTEVPGKPSADDTWPHQGSWVFAWAGFCETENR